jgi:hypothetical protein
MFYVCTALLVAACGDDPAIVEPVPTITGKVTSAITSKPVVGAEVTIGDVVVRTRANGTFELFGVTPGPTTLRVAAAGFELFETGITLTAGTVTRDVGLTRIEVFELGDFALYIPETADVTRGVIITLGGPNTKGFASGEPMGAPIPAVEASLQALGQAIRTLASTSDLAVLGTSRAGLANGPDSDQLLRDALTLGASESGRPELSSVPVILYATSGGTAQASGFTVRNPQRVAAMFLKVPAGVASVTSDAASQVPTYIVQAELDAFVNNAANAAIFEGNRAAGALWALAMEPDVPHHSLSQAQRELTISWLTTILELRLPASGSTGLGEIDESSGWLGNRVTGDATAWANYTGDRASASWLPSQATAEEWESFVAGAASPVLALRSRPGGNAEP